MCAVQTILQDVMKYILFVLLQARLSWLLKCLNIANDGLIICSAEH